MSGRIIGATVLAWALLAGRAPAQEVRTAVVPDGANVGDIVRAAVRVTVAEDAVVVFPDTLDVPDNVEAAARRQITVDTVAPGRVSHTAVYPLALWRPGRAQLPPVTVRVDGVDIETTFPPIEIASVLPADTAEVEPRPARDVIGASRLIWPIALAVAALVMLIAAAVWYYRRRRPATALAPRTPPREIALAELDRIRRLGHLERGEIKPFYTAVAGVLRRYTAQLDPRWGAQLTTTELWRVMERALEEEMPLIPRRRAAGTVSSAPAPAGIDGSNEAGELYSMLGRADLVKFARARPPAEEGQAVWDEARTWVERFPPQPEPETDAEVESR